MKTAIIYKTLRGTTRRYAEWLHESFDSDIYNIKNVAADTFNAYDKLIFCSCVYMGTITATGFIKKNWAHLKGKEVILVAVGSVPTENVTAKEDLGKFPTEINRAIKYWKLPGAFTGKDKRNVRRENLQPVIDYIHGLSQQKLPHLEMVKHQAGPGVNVAYRIVRGLV